MTTSELNSTEHHSGLLYASYIIDLLSVFINHRNKWPPTTSWAADEYRQQKHQRLYCIVKCWPHSPNVRKVLHCQMTEAVWIVWQWDFYRGNDLLTLLSWPGHHLTFHTREGEILLLPPHLLLNNCAVRSDWSHYYNQEASTIHDSKADQLLIFLSLEMVQVLVLVLALWGKFRYAVALPQLTETLINYNQIFKPF